MGDLVFLGLVQWSLLDRRHRIKAADGKRLIHIGPSYSIHHRTHHISPVPLPPIYQLKSHCVPHFWSMWYRHICVHISLVVHMIWIWICVHISASDDFSLVPLILTGSTTKTHNSQIIYCTNPTKAKNLAINICVVLRWYSWPYTWYSPRGLARIFSASL